MYANLSNDSSSSPSPQKHTNNFMSSLPKANEIFDIGQHLKRNIYPFEMKSKGLSYPHS